MQTARNVKIGVLALQGDFARHLDALGEIGVAAGEVRDPARLDGYAGLVIPGGESTTLLKLLGREGIGAIRRYHEGGGAILGTCAGMILLARRVRDPEQESIGLLDVTVARNAWGRQVESFHAEGVWEGEAPRPLEMVFIRAPRILSCGPGVTVLAKYNNEPVMVRQDRILAATFHPELTRDRGVHALFAAMARGESAAEAVRGAAGPCRQ
jgi:5'-phosphate synthase pdxT subunit